jgi:hypothetical protein
MLGFVASSRATPNTSPPPKLALVQWAAWNMGAGQFRLVPGALAAGSRVSTTPRTNPPRLKPDEQVMTTSPGCSGNGASGCARRAAGDTTTRNAANAETTAQALQDCDRSVFIQTPF